MLSQPALFLPLVPCVKSVLTTRRVLCSDNSKVFRLMNTCRLMVEDFLCCRSRIPPVSLRISLMRFYYLTKKSIGPDTKIMTKRLNNPAQHVCSAVVIRPTFVAQTFPLVSSVSCLSLYTHKLSLSIYTHELTYLTVFLGNFFFVLFF